MKGPNFIDQHLADEFNEKGFVKISQFLDSSQIHALSELYLTYADEHEKIDIPFVSTSHSNNSQLIKAVNDGISTILTPSLVKAFLDFEVLFSNFLLKKPTKNSITNFHEDITIVDESQYLSYSIWFPLSDVTEQNGSMYFIPKSHLFPTYFRTNPYNKSPYRNINELLYEYKEVVNCKSGDAVVFAHKTIHGSFKNQSPLGRIAGVLSMHPKGAKLFHYHLYEEEKRIDCHQMTIADFINLDKSKAPLNAALVKSFHWKDKVYTEKEFLNLLGESYWKHLLKKWI